MNTFGRQRNQRPLFEFEKSGQSTIRPPGGHRPDLNNLSVIQNRNNTNSNYFYSNYNKNRTNSNTSASLDFIDLKSLPTNPVPQVSSSYDNSLLSKNNQMKNKKHRINMGKRTFDTLFLVDLLNTSNFDKITEINASSQSLTDIDITTLKQLKIVKKADFSDNSLPLEPFSVLQNLEELDMSCNGLKKFEFEKCEKEYIDLDDDGRAWKSLHTLNLSHNMCANMISDLQLIPLLSNLNLSSNSITSLPSNLMYFTCLTTLDLSNNNLNSDSSLFALATIPALQVLNLDYNGLVRIPKFQFGFEALNKISLKSNYFEEADDFDSLADILSLQEVNIIDNPITIRGSKYLAQARKTFANAKINLICYSPTQPVKSTLTGSIRTVPVDPLTLPFHSRAHRRALNENANRRPQARGSQKVPPLNIDPNPATNNTDNQNNNNNNDDDVFMTPFISKADDNKNKKQNNEKDKIKPDTDNKNEMLQRIEDRMMMNMNTNQNTDSNLDFRIPNIQPTQIPPPTFDDDESTQTNIWSEIPFFQEDRRKSINKQVSVDYKRALNQLQFLVFHPEANPGNVNSLDKGTKKEDDESQKTGTFDGIYYNNEDYVFSSEFTNEYHEGDEIDEIQDLLQNRNQIPSRNRASNKLGFRNRGTPIPTARRSKKSDEMLDEKSPSDDENKKLTREEINGIIQDMDDKLLSVEKDLQDADDERNAEKRRQLREKYRIKKFKMSGRNSRNDYDDDDDSDDDFESGDRFARLNKQYETIRASLVKTLTES